MVYNLGDAGNMTMAAALSVLVVEMVLVMIMLEAFAHRLPKGVIPWRS